MILGQQLSPLPALGHGPNQLPAQGTILLGCSGQRPHGPIVDLERFGSQNFESDARRRRQRQNDPTPLLQLAQNGQRRAGLPSPVDGPPLPALTQSPSQCPATRSA